MTGFLLDTNIPSELVRIQPEPRVTTWLQGLDNRDLFLSVITIGEICKGFTILGNDKRRQKLEQWLNNDLRPWFADRILPVNESVAERWGIFDGESQLRGKQINIADGLIAATAYEHKLTIVTRNLKDFVGLGVELFNPWDQT